MLDVALAALHHDAAHAGVPGLAVGAGVSFGEMEVGVGHHESAVDAVEAHFAVAFLEGERVGDGDFAAIEDPSVHAPEMTVVQREADFIGDARDEGQLLGGADGAADAGGIVGRGLFPRVDILESFGEVEVFEGVVEDDLEAGARELQELLGRELGGGFDDGGVEGGIIPPVGREAAKFAWHKSDLVEAIVGGEMG